MCIAKSNLNSENTANLFQINVAVYFWHEQVVLCVCVCGKGVDGCVYVYEGGGGCNGCVCATYEQRCVCACL